MDNLIKMIEKLTNTFGAPGYEDEVIEVIKKELPFLSSERDSINNYIWDFMKRKQIQIDLL